MTELGKKFKERLDVLRNAQGYVRLLCGERDRMGFRCTRVDTTIDEFNGGAHSTSSRCGDYKSCEKCEQKCEHQQWNSDAVDLNLKLRNARHDRNWAIINLFFMTRKGAQLAKYVWLKVRVAKLFKAYDAALDKLSGMKSNDPQYDKAVEDKRQKEIAYCDVVQQIKVARAKLWVSTK